MRRAQPKALACLLMAMLMFIGTSSQALASLLCQTETCPKKAAQAREAEQKSCCPTTANEPSQEEEDGCCCKIESVPDLSDRSTKITPPQTQIDLALPQEPDQLIGSDTISIPREIPAYSDLSPPNAPIARDRGRAPPVA